jgi:hypothetical protein
LVVVGEWERTPEGWARSLGLALHGMTDARWGAYLRYLEGADRAELAGVFKRLLDEARVLQAALRADKRDRPENREERIRVSRGLRRLRTQRLAALRGRDDAEHAPEEWEDAFEAIVDDPDADFMGLYVTAEPVGPGESVDVPRYRTLQEAYEAWKKEREEKEDEA